MKVRADQLLVLKGLANSRNEAQSLILAGSVFSSKGRIEKSGQLLAENEVLEVKAQLPFVGRGGLKLDHALTEFAIDVNGLICLDVGASTGGFTDCLLQRGAKKVYAVDVGYGQLHYKLRKNPRVVLYEKTNFRHFDVNLLSEKIDLAVADVSFISLAKIFPKMREALKPAGKAVVLVKPQFELGPKEAKKGVVRSQEDRDRAVAKVSTEARSLGFQVQGLCWSPVEGAKGNREALLYLLV